MVPLFRGGGTDAGYWLREAGPVVPTRPLEGDVRADVVIVGGGYAGMWTAWAIREQAPEARVVVLEARACGEGPSGRNAGFVNSFWHRLDGLTAAFGETPALAVCEHAASSVDEIERWAGAEGVDVWFRKAGHLKVATSSAQEGRWAGAVEACARTGRESEYVTLDADAVRSRCSSPLFGGGALLAQAATVQPARLALGLRKALLREGVALHERTRARRLATGRSGEVVVETDAGARVTASAAVVAINAAAAGFPPLRNRLTVTSTHMVVTERVPDVLEEIGWTGGESISTSRAYLHYFRTTTDGRIAFGWGGGRIAYGARLGGRVESDPEVIDAVRGALVEHFPALRDRRIEFAWGGPVDVSPNRLPVLGTLPDGRTHYVYGFTGNGVGPAHLAGKVLAGLALGLRNELTGLAIVEPEPARVPPEPARWLGGSLVRGALLRSEQREDAGLPVGAATRAILEMPRRLGIHVGR
jgi:glycine/D-amino acid oxidase-like deaminating enzyme